MLDDGLRPTATPAGSGAPAAGPTVPLRAVSVRERYLDVLRFIAIDRVILYHALSFVWLTYVFPAMGVMFALGGSLMANSMAKPAGRAVRNRIRRLLPALWVAGAIAVPLMIYQANRAGTPEHLPGFPELFAWVFPIVDPPGTPWTEPLTGILWYIVAYLWLVMLSPLVIRVYRRMPGPTIVFPLAVLAVIELVDVDLGSRAGDVVLNLATFGSCWIVGFAHRDGRLAQMPLPRLVVLAALTMGAGTVWAFAHPDESTGVDLNAIPLALGLYSFGFVLLVLRLRPSMAWLARRRVLSWLVTATNARAVTIYLWHHPAIKAAAWIGDRLHVARFGDQAAAALCLVITVGLIAMITLAVGWVEDVAARRPARLVPR